MIDILLATYNGDKYIGEQLGSIINQTYQDWIVYIRDDGSNDDTVSIIKSYTALYPDKFVFIDDSLPSGSAKANFLKLLQYSKSEYVMFCDQDDVWLNDKIENTLKLMVQIETEQDVMCPVLVHTDLTVVDSNLDVISNSFFDYQKLSKSKVKLANLLVQNNVTGCTVMVNRLLVDIATKEVSPKCLMHDWWFALFAQAYGKIAFLDKPTILYRQHSSNQVGAKNSNGMAFILNRLKNFKKIQEAIYDTYNQADGFYQACNEIEFHMPFDNLLILKKYCDLINKNKIVKIATIIRYSFFKYGLSRILGQFLFC